jgi:hypothetical protein
MYQDANLKNYIEQSSSVNLESIVLAEWNMNFSDNILTLGNYRHRPNIASPTEANFGDVKAAWALETSASSPQSYFNATNWAFELTDSNQIQSWANAQEAHQSLSDLINSNPSNGNVLKYDGTNWVAASSSIDDSNYAKKDSDNAFAGVIQQQLSGSSSYSYTKVFDATSNNTTEFSLVNVPVDPAQAHHVKCEVVAVGHNGATTIRKLSCCVCNSNQTMTQSNEYGDDGLFPIDLGKCEFNVASNFLRNGITPVC